MDWVWHLFFGANLLLLFLGLVFVLLLLLAYLLIAVGLYKIAQKRNMQYPWLAWVPVVRYYLLGQMLNNQLRITKQLIIPQAQYILPGAVVVAYLGSGSFLGGVFSFASVVLIMLAFAALFRQYRDRNAIIYGILTGIPLVQVIGSIFVLKLGDLPVPDLSADTTVFPNY